MPFPTGNDEGKPYAFPTNDDDDDDSKKSNDEANKIRNNKRKLDDIDVDCNENGPSRKRQRLSNHDENNNKKDNNNDGWMCSICTYNNASEMSYCEICETKKPILNEDDEKKIEIGSKDKGNVTDETQDDIIDYFVAGTDILKQEKFHNIPDSLFVDDD